MKIASFIYVSIQSLLILICLLGKSNASTYCLLKAYKTSEPATIFAGNHIINKYENLLLDDCIKEGKKLLKYSQIQNRCITQPFASPCLVNITIKKVKYQFTNDAGIMTKGTLRP
jgi:hypothetical protein